MQDNSSATADLPNTPITLQLEERTLKPLVTERGDTIRISGPLPENAYITAESVELTHAAELADVQRDAQILFAYDIKIIQPPEIKGGEPAEYLPMTPVTVTITPFEKAPIRSPVTVTHISEHMYTGETIPQAVAKVKTKDDGTVAFLADQFSIYVVTTTSTVLSTTPIIYWNGTGFFADEICSPDNAVTDENGTPYTTLPALLAAIDSATTIYMKAGYTVANTLTISNSFVTLMRHATYLDALITVSSGGSLALSNITIDGGSMTAQNAAVHVESNGHLEIGSGTTIQNNYHDLSASARYGGGGVMVDGTAVMNGGAIQNNQVSWSGTTGYGGAGIAINGGTFTMGGGNISNNTASLDAGGGAVLLRADSTFTLNNGTLQGNESAYGGAVYNYGRTVIMNGGTIDRNSARDSGGGFYCASEYSLTINGGYITNNTCEASDSSLYGYGGAINMNSGLLQINGGTSYGNVARSSSGAYIQSAQTVIIDGGTLQGGVYSNNVNTVFRNTSGELVHPITIQVSDGHSAVGSTNVSNITFSPAYTYNCKNMKTDGNGYLYLYVPYNTTVLAVDDYTVISLTASIVPNTDPPVVGTILTATVNGSATITSYQWQRYTGNNWIDIPVNGNASTYIITPSESNRQVRVIINDVYPSMPVTVAMPSYTVTIPDNVNINAAPFSITGSLTNFGTGQFLNVNVTPAGEGEIAFELVGTNQEGSLTYALRPGNAAAPAVPSGGVIATFTNASPDLVPVYCSLIDAPNYAGTYQDSLTFTVSFHDGTGL